MLHSLFERQAELRPDAVALVCGGRITTYSELDRRANQLSVVLREQGVGRGCFVAILLPRSEELYQAILGVLKSGATYVPLDPDFPIKRLKFALADCQASALLTNPFLGLKAEFGGKTILVEPGGSVALTPISENLKKAEPVSAEDVCYVIYTSGTTGRPKGVQIEHRSIVHLVEAEQQIFHINPSDRIFQGFSIAFDASLEEIWLAFAAGATLVVGTTEMMRSGPSLSRILAEARVTVMSCVPTLLTMMEEDVPGLRLLILGGEVCPPELVKRWWRSDRRVVNTYGPTEATVIATFVECFPDKPITIGRPLPGYITWVVDEQLEPVPEGEPGELLLGGVGVARGYLGKADLTDEKFIVRSFDGNSPQRFYRTGDRVRYNAQQELEFLGRLDTQVKIRGFRVELAEIESVLLEFPEVKSTAAALKETEGIQQLCAYVVPRLGSVIDLERLSARLKQRLPAYMVPGSIQILSMLPTLPSGKVDRNSLPNGSSLMGNPLSEADTPVNEQERRLVETWSRLFANSNISTTDDFFSDLGGHSLLAARMVSEMRRLPGFEGLSVADIYRYPTAKQLTQALGQRRVLDNGFSVARSEKGFSEFEAKSIDDTLGAFATEEIHNKQRRNLRPFETVPFWKYFLCGCAQLFSLIFVLSFFALQWLAPYLTYTVMIEEEYSFTVSILSALSSLILLYPIMLLLTIGVKWLVIGRYRPGNYPLWGGYYFRFWLVKAIAATVPVSYMSGTPLLSVYLRLMGAKIGRNVFLNSESFLIYDLLQIGDGSSINAEASLLGYSVSNGRLQIGSITIGERCFVGTRSVMAEDSVMEDGSSLEDLSVLGRGEQIGPGEIWRGSPAQPRHMCPGGISRSAFHREQAPSVASATKPIALALLHGIGLLIFPVLVVAALFPGIVVMNRLNYLDPYYWYLLLSPLVGSSFVGLLGVEIVALKWLLLGRIRPGQHSISSWFYVRKWFIDKTLELSLDVIGPLYASVYLSPWYRMLGAKLGAGAEISTASFISPDLLTIGEESFIADNVSLGAPVVRDGVIQIGANRIGRRAFVGNSAVLRPDTELGDEVLIGCLSAAPETRSDALLPDSAWLGSPSFALKQRFKSHGFGEESTFYPSARLRALRAAIEFARVIAPSTGFIILTSLLFSALLLLHDTFTLTVTLFFFPALYLACGLCAAVLTISLKWALVGRYRACEKPLWSTFVWRNELINALHEHLAGPFLVDALIGTPFISWYLRLLGAQVGRRAYIETTDFSEFDLTRIGDEAALNSDCTVQTHLFEDRIMKMSVVDIGARCSIGAKSLVLYDTRMEPGTILGPLSLLMKGEILPAGTDWVGIPARAQVNSGTQRQRSGLAG
jgi:non-ribosomal peptide synthetase-like protein